MEWRGDTESELSWTRTAAQRKCCLGVGGGVPKYESSTEEGSEMG